MKFRPLIGADLSGSVGGITASHNKGGPYFRTRAIPTDPNTGQQALVRSIVSDLSNLWQNTLTAAQRAAWGVYATNVPLPDTLGESRPVSGLNMYVRSNSVRLQVGLSRIDIAPVIFNLGTFTAPIITSASAAGQTVTFSLTNSNTWAVAVGGALCVYGSRPQNSGITFFKGPFRFGARVNGAVAPPASPATVAMPFPLAVGQKLFVRFVAVTADGRVSAPVIGAGLVS